MVSPHARQVPSAAPTDPQAGLYRRLGMVTLVLGLVALASTGFLWLLSTTDVVDPANWVRALGLLGIPVGMVGSLVVGVTAAARPGRGRLLALVGMALAGLALVLFLVAMFTLG